MSHVGLPPGLSDPGGVGDLGPSLPRVCPRLVAVMVSLVLGVQPVSGAPRGTLTVRAEPRRVPQGGLVRLFVGHDPSWSPAVHSLGRRLPLSPTGRPGKSVTLLGIDVDCPVGPRTVVVEAPNGGTERLKLTLEVVGGRFDVQRLKVAPKMVEPGPALKQRLEREEALVKQVLAVVSPGRFSMGFRRPVKGKITARFGGRRVFNGKPRSPHAGTDLRAAAGTPVLAPSSGRVALVHDLYFSGTTVVLDHGLGLFTQYGHLKKSLVRPGVVVKAGQRLGLSGQSGRVTGPHLHWAAVLGGARIDAMALTQPLVDIQVELDEDESPGGTFEDAEDSEED